MLIFRRKVVFFLKIHRGVTIDNDRLTFLLEEPEVCPHCKHAIQPQELNCSGYKGKDNERYVVLTYLCKHCYRPFIASHDIKKSSSGNLVTTLLFVEPNRFVRKEFDDRISAVSPDFVEIYNQALAAEASGLDQISGIGYRKALEFLIKDYLINKTPDDAEVIKKMELGNCIANKVSNDNLKAVASRSTWLGNDQTHYVQSFEEYDISDMKRFINAVVYWISMELITAEALAMEPRGR